LQEVWRHALELPAASGPHVWLHGDLKPTNVLVQDGKLHAVIDFGALSVGLPDAEHAVVWDLPEAAREAYRASLAIDDLTWARARAWALAPAVNGIAEYWTTFPTLATEGFNRLQAIIDDAR
jgi:aminoglycoside phosphotransferase (APT) family kinase protein